MEIVFLIWVACGIVGHIRQSNEMVTWCGTPVWEEFGTYMMFVPAAIAGPLILFTFERYDDRHPEREHPQS